MNIVQIPSPNCTQTRQGVGIDTFVIHWIDGTQSVADLIFKDPNQAKSAHFSVEGSLVHQYVKIQDIAWHAGNWEWNRRSIGIEVSAQPGRDATTETLETLAQLIAAVAKQLGKPLVSFSIKRHRDIIATACPGTVPVEAVWQRALVIEAGSVSTAVDQPIAQNPIPAIVASVEIHHYSFQYNLQPGNTGEEVGKLQDALIALGLVSDIAGMKAGRGVYGPRTSQAVATFQVAHGIISNASDYGAGYFGPHTRQVINNL